MDENGLKNARTGRVAIHHHIDGLKRKLLGDIAHECSLHRCRLFPVPVRQCDLRERNDHSSHRQGRLQHCRGRIQPDGRCRLGLPKPRRTERWNVRSGGNICGLPLASTIMQTVVFEGWIAETSWNAAAERIGVECES